jgi:hypothetical protein
MDRRLLSRPRFAIRHLFALSALVAATCAFIAAGPYVRLALAALFLPLLPAILVAAIAACFSSTKTRTAVTSILLIPLIWTQFPWTYLRVDIWGLAVASLITGVIASLAAQIINGLRSRTFDRDQHA